MPSYHKLSHLSSAKRQFLDYCRSINIAYGGCITFLAQRITYYTVDCSSKCNRQRRTLIVSVVYACLATKRKLTDFCHLIRTKLSSSSVVSSLRYRRGRQHDSPDSKLPARSRWRLWLWICCAHIFVLHCDDIYTLVTYSRPHLHLPSCCK
jgi:hypothetical protein